MHCRYSFNLKDLIKTLNKILSLHLPKILSFDTNELKLTWTNNLNFSLSSGGLPLAVGYSQSRSRPSNRRSRRYLMADWIKAFLVSEVVTMRVNGAVPRFHPPTASSVFSSELTVFKSLNLEYLGTEMNIRFSNFKRIIIALEESFKFSSAKP